VFDENSSHNIWVEIYSENDRELLSDSRTAAAWIALFEFYDSSDDLSARTFWTRLRLFTARKKESVFLANKELFEA